MIIHGYGKITAKLYQKQNIHLLSMFRLKFTRNQGIEGLGI